MEISLKSPGKPAQLPHYIIDELKNLHPKYKRNLSFFGGHPVSITKQSSNQIFTQISQKQDGTLQSPYLVCQKTDGVRYIMIVCHVEQQDIIEENNISKKDAKIQCYLISRQGQYKLVSYATQINIGNKWNKKRQGNFRHIIQILDGQLIMDNIKNKQVCKYLVFDLLVHMSQNITSLPLLYRLKAINQFIQCNNFLLESVPKQTQKNRIPIEMKDFFRLNCQKYNIVKFLLYKYIKCLPHENDGLIFNHQAKQYQFGMNTGYIKWKPAHLNTLDFMLVPNTNLSQRFQKQGNKVLDMYLAKRDTQIEGNYVRYFYAFTVVPQEQYKQIQQQISINKDKAYEMKDQNQQNLGDKGHFQGAVIAECKFEQTTIQERDIFRQIFDINKDPSQIAMDIMKPYNQKQQTSRVQSLQKIIYDRCWKIYKVRDDKGLPNNLTVAQKIEQSIKDDIQQLQLIKKNDELTEKCRPKY